MFVGLLLSYVLIEYHLTLFIRLRLYVACLLAL
jgi:hypothetical protein